MTYKEAKYTNNPYQYDEGRYEHVLIKSLTGSNTVYRPSLLEQYRERIDVLNNYYLNRVSDLNERGNYLESLYEVQEKIGYFPEFDLRVQESYKSAMSRFDEYYAQQMENGSETVKDYITEQRKQFETDLRDQLGFYPNRPDEHQCCEQNTENSVDMETQNEESWNMEKYVELSGPGKAINEECNQEKQTFEMSEYVGLPTPEESKEISEEIIQEEENSHDYAMSY